MIITFEPNVIRLLFLNRLLLLNSALEITIHDTKYKEKENMHIRITVSFELINIFIQVIFPNIISYLDRTSKEKQNDINFKIK